VDRPLRISIERVDRSNRRHAGNRNLGVSAGSSRGIRERRSWRRHCWDNCVVVSLNCVTFVLRWRRQERSMIPRDRGELPAVRSTQVLSGEPERAWCTRGACFSICAPRRETHRLGMFVHFLLFLSPSLPFSLSVSMSTRSRFFRFRRGSRSSGRARGAAVFVTFKPAVGRGSLVSGPCHVEKSMQPGVYNNVAVTAHYANTTSISSYDVDSSRALRQSCRPSSGCSDPFAQKFAVGACRASTMHPRAFGARVSPFATSDDGRVVTRVQAKPN